MEGQHGMKTCMARWNKIMDVQHRMQVWMTSMYDKLDCKYGMQESMAKVDYKSGLQEWITRVECKYGMKKWNARMDDTYGMQKYSIPSCWADFKMLSGNN